MSPSVHSSERDHAFDGLRGIAVLAIVGCHLSQLCLHWKLCGFEFWQGACGAHLLLMASGFAMAIVASRTATWKQFVTERFSRVYPLYAAAVVFSAALIVVFQPPTYEVTWLRFLASMTMLQSWLGVGEVDGAFWLAGVLLKFYVLIGAVILLRQRHRLELFAVSYLAFIAVWRVAVALGAELHETMSRALNDKVAHLLVAGMVLWIIQHKGLTTTRGLAIVACMGLEVAGSPMPIGSAIVVGIILVCFVRDRLSFLSMTPLPQLGHRSFAIYMFHGVISYVVMNVLLTYSPNSMLTAFVTLLVVLVVAELFYRGVEIPMKARLRARCELKLAFNAATEQGLEMERDLERQASDLLASMQTFGLSISDDEARQATADQGTVQGS